MKLSSIEKRVLQYIIENSDGTNSICVNIPDINTEFLIQAVSSLDNLGLVKSCNTLCSASAFLTQRGLSYFEDLEREEYGDLRDVISTLNGFINKAKQLKQSNNCEEIETFIRQSFIPYSDCLHADTIYGFKTTFGNYANEDLDSYHADLDYIIVIFNKIKNDKKLEAKTLQVEKVKIENHIHNENTNIVDIKIDLTQVYNQITESQELSPEEKIELQQLIQDALKEKNKKSLWGKIKNIIGKIADKTFDLAVAVLPVLTEAMLKAKGMI